MPSSPSLRALGGVFARYGNLTLGGGSATIAVLQQEIVVKRGWLAQVPFSLSYALSRLTPGTNLLAFCTAAGWIIRGLAGAFVALVAASVPCSILAVLATYLYQSWARYPVTLIGLRGALAAAVGIMFVTCWQLASPHFQKTACLKFPVLIGGSFALAWYFFVPPLRVLLLAAVVGWFWPVRSPA
jgi:chromate transporter